MPLGCKNPESGFPYAEAIVEITKTVNKIGLKVSNRQINLSRYQYDISVYGFALHVVIQRFDNAWGRLFPPHGKSDASIGDRTRQTVASRSGDSHCFAGAGGTTFLGIQQFFNRRPRNECVIVEPQYIVNSIGVGRLQGGSHAPVPV